LSRPCGTVDEEVARKYAITETAEKAVIKGATESLSIDRVYRGHLADMLDALP
jgi:hypothetical protein